MAGNPKRDRFLSIGFGIGIVVAGGVLAYQHGLIDPALVESLSGGMMKPQSEGGGESAGADRAAGVAGVDGAGKRSGGQTVEGPGAAKPGVPGKLGAPGKPGEKATATKANAKAEKAMGNGLAAKDATQPRGTAGTQGSAREGASRGVDSAELDVGEESEEREESEETTNGADGSDPADALLLPSTEAKSAVEDLAVPQALSEIEGWRSEGKAPDASRLRRYLTHRKAWVALTAYAWAVETKALTDAELATTGHGLKQRHPAPLLRRVLKRFAVKPEVAAVMRTHLGLTRGAPRVP